MLRLADESSFFVASYFRVQVTYSVTVEATAFRTEMIYDEQGSIKYI